MDRRDDRVAFFAADVFTVTITSLFMSFACRAIQVDFGEVNNLWLCVHIVCCCYRLRIPSARSRTGYFSRQGTCGGLILIGSHLVGCPAAEFVALCGRDDIGRCCFECCTERQERAK